MKKKSIIIGSYAILVIIGGVIGAIVAQSAASLIASGIFGLLLLICAACTWRGFPLAETAATVLVGLLFAFFTYRYFLAFKLFPGAVMAVISLAVLGFLRMTERTKEEKSA